MLRRPKFPLWDMGGESSGNAKANHPSPNLRQKKDMPDLTSKGGPNSLGQGNYSAFHGATSCQRVPRLGADVGTSIGMGVEGM